LKRTEHTQLRVDARLIALILFVATLVIRLPFQTEYLYHWDSVNMAYGIIDFNVLEGAPHFPGYIVYIAIAQIVNRVFNDPQTTMVVISMVSSGLAVAAIFYLGRAMFNSVTGLIAALFTMTSPLVWFYSEIALPHTLDLFAIIFSAYLLYKIMEGETRLLPVAAVVLALVGGFRQQNLLFLGPLILFAIYRAGVRRIIVFIAIAAVVCLVWFIPMMQNIGGVQNYLTLSSAFSQEFWRTTSLLHGAGFDGVRGNLLKLIPYTGYALLLVALPLLYWVTQIGQWRAALRSRKAWFLVLWAVPTLLFYIIIHMGQQGLVFVFLPILILLSAHALYRMLNNRPALLWAVSSAIALLNAVVFVLAPTYPLGEDQFKLLTYSTLRENDARLAGIVTAVNERFDPQNTLLVSIDWRHIQYYLPGFEQVRLNLADGVLSEDDGTLPAGYASQPLDAEHFGLSTNARWQVVLLDQELLPFAAGTIETIDAPGGSSFGALTLDADQSVQFTPTQIGVVD
jgi:4-amino-4-deoxy-L-arabinose transferase-like glycosyltransferase